jgi:hypothetical protein
LARKELLVVATRKAFKLGVAAAAVLVCLAGLRVGAEPPATAPAPRPKPAATGIVSPKAVVLAAWEDDRTSLTSGHGEGAFEHSCPDGKTIRYAVKVSFAGAKFWAELTYLPGQSGPPFPDTLVVIYDGEALAYREVRPHHEQAQLFRVKPGAFDQYPCPLRLPNFTRLHAQVVHLPAFLRNRPGTSFAFAPDGVDGTLQLCEEPPIRVTMRFPRTAGYNVASRETFRADIGSRSLETGTWGRSNGVWYVREYLSEDTRPGERRSYPTGIPLPFPAGKGE